MIVSIDTGSRLSPYEQVRSQVADQINTGELPVGSKLPTVRNLAGDLGIAPNTVARAYRELEAAGLLETKGRAGTFVAAGKDKARRKAAAAAKSYARTVISLGISDDEALAIVGAALRAESR
ncbi:GntR family transcriptional regulator [Haloechinothrix salitolerans]|uniref:GntR family transcriptional regulator n=1 Tax=Haloechinothrix salitolerans TaxID=926830 RepID=A0ABW2C8T2_9PSEU